MQKPNHQMLETVMFPIPAELLEELDIGPLTTVQMTVYEGRLIIEPIDAPHNMICCGNCRRCRGASLCESRYR